MVCPKNSAASSRVVCDSSKRSANLTFRGGNSDDRTPDLKVEKGRWTTTVLLVVRHLFSWNSRISMSGNRKHESISGIVDCRASSDIPFHQSNKVAIFNDESMVDITN